MNEQINELRHNCHAAEDFFAKRLAFTLGPVELTQMLADNKVKLIDVRKKEDYSEGHIPQAISIPKSEIKDRLSELSRNEVYVLCCYNQQCHLASAAAYFLAKECYSVMELEGGFEVWKEDFGFEVTKN